MIHLTLFDALLFFLISSVYPRDVTQYSEHCCILGFVDWKKGCNHDTHKRMANFIIGFFYPPYCFCLVRIDLCHHYSKIRSTNSSQISHVLFMPCVDFIFSIFKESPFQKQQQQQQQHFSWPKLFLNLVQIEAICYEPGSQWNLHDIDTASGIWLQMSCRKKITLQMKYLTQSQQNPTVLREGWPWKVHRGCSAPGWEGEKSGPNPRACHFWSKSAPAPHNHRLPPFKADTDLSSVRLMTL